MAIAAPAFDTLTTARDLEAAGLERRQAEAVASAIGNAGGHVATKADLEHLATGTDLERLRADLYRALWIQAGAIVAAIAALAGIAFALAGVIAGAAA